MVKFIQVLFLLSLLLVGFTKFCLPLNKIGFAPSISSQWAADELLLSDRMMFIMVISSDFINPLIRNATHCYLFTKKSSRS